MLIDNKILSQSPNHIFVTKSKRAPSGAVEGLSVQAPGYTWRGIFPTVTALLENLISVKMYHNEENSSRKEIDMAGVQ